MLKQPAVSGMFYPAGEEALRESIENSFTSSFGVGEIPTLKCENYKGDYPFNVFVPHAGFIYSGPAASFAYDKIVREGFPDTFIILSPNHTGIGKEISVFNEGEWITPLGNVKVDEDFANAIINNADKASSDFTAHIQEHSIELQLPFLQYFSNNFKIVPITFGYQSFENTLEVAKAIVSASKEVESSYCVIASTDLSHFYTQEGANSADSLVLQDIEEMNSKKLFDDVISKDITMCGYGPVLTTIELSKLTGLNQSEVFTHYTSGDITGDLSRVVGYASGIFK